MVFNQDRSQLRRFYFQSWNKYKNNLAMEPMETIVATLIKQHPEYHDFFNDLEKNQNKDFTPDMGQSNPFLHLGMHISIQEQLSTQRPAALSPLYQSLCKKTDDAHEAEHQIINCLGEMLWLSQKNNQPLDETTYIECVKKLL